MKKLSIFFVVLASLLSHTMCVCIAYNYRDMLCGIKHMGYSAPADIVFLLAIPYVICIVTCMVLAFVFHKKSLRNISRQR